MKAHIYAGALLAIVATPALATPPWLAETAVNTVVASQAQTQGQSSTNVGINENGSTSGAGASSTSDNGGNSVTNKSGDSRALGVALSQAPTAVTGICGKGTKFGFGALEWTDFSSKCFNYMIALEAAKQGNYDLANQWVERADQM